MHESSPLKQVLFFTNLNKFWLFINEAILGLNGSKLKCPSISPPEYLLYLAIIDCFVMEDYKYYK